MAKMDKAEFAAKLQDWTDRVIKAQADDERVDDRGWRYSYDVPRMLQDVNKLLSRGFDKKLLTQLTGGTGMKFRIFDVHTGETLTIFEAEDMFTASVIAGKWYGPNNEDVDIESYEEA